MHVLTEDARKIWNVTRVVQSAMGFTMGLYLFTYGPLFYESFVTHSNPHTAMTMTTFLMGVVMALTAILEVPTGAIGDAIGRKRTIVWSFLFRSLFFLCLAAVPLVASIASIMTLGLMAMITFSLSYTFYSGTFTAWCIDSFHEKSNGTGYEHLLSRAYTYNFLAKMIGGIIGVLLYLEHLPQIGFLGAAIISVLCVVYCLGEMDETTSLHFLNTRSVSLAIITQRIGKILGVGFQVFSRSPAILSLVAIYAAFMTVLNIVDYLWPIYLRSNVPVDQQAVSWIALVLGTLLVSTGGSHILTMIGGAFARKGRLRTDNRTLQWVLASACLMSSVSVLWLSFSSARGEHNLISLGVAVIMTRFAFGIIAPCFETLINNYIPSEYAQERATIMSFGSLVRCVVAMLLVIPAGGSGGRTTATGWALPAALLLVTVIVALVVLQKRRHVPTQLENNALVAGGH